MERLVETWAHLPEAQAVIVVQIAKTRSVLFGATEDYLVGREFRDMTTLDQRLDLIHCLYEVSAADRSISTVEDNEIQRIARELQVPHRDVIAIRLQHREHLAVLT